MKRILCSLEPEYGSTKGVDSRTCWALPRPFLYIHELFQNKKINESPNLKEVVCCCRWISDTLLVAYKIRAIENQRSITNLSAL
jgi:hypothetical protein